MLSQSTQVGTVPARLLVLTTELSIATHQNQVSHNSTAFGSAPFKVYESLQVTRIYIPLLYTRVLTDVQAILGQG